MKRRQSGRRPAARTATGRNRTAKRPAGRRPQEKLFTLPTTLFFAVLIFMCFSVIAVQSYRINKANIQINRLQAKLEDARMLNDSLEGQLLSKKNLKNVERIAKDEYGMVEPRKKDYVAVDMNDSNKEKQTANGSQAVKK